MRVTQARSIYVANLPWSTTEEDLARLFGQFAEVAAARVVKDPATGRPQGYGFVDLRVSEEVPAVCATLDGCLLNGRQLVVRPARAPS